MSHKHCSIRGLPRRLVTTAWLAVAVAAIAPAQGFESVTHLVGAKPHTVALKRILPATVNLNGKRIFIEYDDLTRGGLRGSMPGGYIQGKMTVGDLAVLKTKLITAIQKDNRFVEAPSAAQAETILSFKVTDYYLESRQRQTGNNQNCTVIVGKIEVAYQAHDRMSASPLDSENLTAALNLTTDRGPSAFAKVPLIHKQGACNTESAAASPNEARDNLIDEIVAQMTKRAAPTEQTVIVPVPRGKLDGLSAIAASARWGTLLEEAEKMDKLPKPADDSYRVYLVGLANEGLAYDAARDASDRERNRRGDMTSPAALQSMAAEDKDYQTAEDYIDKAAKAYKDAIELKPDEKFFREPDARIEQAVKLYATIMRHKEEYRQAMLKKQGRSGGPASPSVTPVSGAAAQPSFDRVLVMCQQKVAGVSQLIHDHPGDLRFTRVLSFDQDLALRKDCGVDAPNIVNEINLQARRNAGSAKKK